MGPTGCTETSFRNYHYSLRNNPEQRTSRKLIAPHTQMKIFLTCVVMDFTASLSGFHTACSYVYPLATIGHMIHVCIWRCILSLRLPVRHFSLTLCCGRPPPLPPTHHPTRYLFCLIPSSISGTNTGDDTYSAHLTVRIPYRGHGR